MNIVCYINKLNDGGAERVMSVLANGLFKRGHKVIMVTDYSTPNEYPLEDGVIRVTLDGDVSDRNPNAGTRTKERIAKLRKICKENQVDIVVSFMRLANFRSILATRFLKTKNLISVRIDPKIGYRNKKEAMLAKVLYPLSNGCVFQTYDAKAWFSPKIQKKSSIIFNPVSAVFYHIEPAAMQEKKIVTCGRLEKQKRFDLLIDAFHKVCDEFPEYTLEIYGVGAQQESLQEKINTLGRQERIKLMGRSEDVPNTIKTASLFVLSSDYEGLPNALMEAMALGLPVVSTDCGGGGARALIENGVDGLIVPCNDVAALAEAIRQNLADPEAAKLRGEKAGEKAKGFSTENVVTQWEDYIKQIVNKSIG